MGSQNLNPNSNISGATNSVPQPEEFFMQNLRAFRQYAGQRGAYFDEHGWLVYRGKVLTRSDSEYLDQSEVTRQRLLDEEELEAAWQNLLFYAGE
jgi:hypothetical protein